MSFLNKHKITLCNVLFSIFIFSVFYKMASSVPLMGDDWDFATQSRTSSVINSAIAFYYNWSGRFFSEVWCFFMNSHKEIWNFSISFVFTGIYLAIIRLIHAKKNEILVMLCTVASILLVNYIVRIQTYAWVTGSFYPVPLFFILIHFIFMKDLLLNGKSLSTFKILFLCLLNLYIGCSAQNIAAVSVFANFLFLFYCSCFKKEKMKIVIVPLLVSIISLIILSISPGSNYRLMTTSFDWTQLTLFEQISINWNNFLSYTFTKNNFMMFSLGTTLFSVNFLIFKRERRVTFKNTVYFLYNITCVFFSLSQTLFDLTTLPLFKVFYDHMYTSSALILCTLFYLSFIVVLLFELTEVFKNHEYFEALFYLFVGGSANVILLISPTFGARSSIYTIYLITVLILFIISKLDFNIITVIVITLVLLNLIISKCEELSYKYGVVASIQAEREFKIKYYQENPEDLEIYLPRFPKDYVHSGDIDDDDFFHMKVFKDYYRLNSDAVIKFYK